MPLLIFLQADVVKSCMKLCKIGFFSAVYGRFWLLYTKNGQKQLKMSWFYVISYNFWRCRLAKRSKAASKTGQRLLKNTNISITTVNWRVLHTEIWNIWEIDCIFRPKPCHHLFIEITLVFHIVYDPWSFQVLILTISPDKRPKPLTHLTGCKIGSVGWK